MKSSGFVSFMSQYGYTKLASAWSWSFFVNFQIARSGCWVVNISDEKARCYSKAAMMFQSVQPSKNKELYLFWKVIPGLFPSFTKFIVFYKKNSISSFTSPLCRLGNNWQYLVMSPCIAFQQILTTSENMFKIKSSDMHLIGQIFVPLTKFEVNRHW